MEWSIPFELTIGGIAINVHLLFELLAFFLGFRFFMYLRGQQDDPIPSGNRLWIIIGAALGAFIGSRLIGALEDPRLFLNPPNGILYYYQSKTIIGALLGGLLGVEWTKKYIGESNRSGDLFTFPLILGIAIGRIGCFLTGINEPTYGLPSNLPWAINLGDGISRHPTALYEIIFLLLLWGILFYFNSQIRRVNGLRFQLFMFCYFVFRFFLEFIKPGYAWFVGLNTLQLSSLVGICYYLILWTRLLFFQNK